jgi:DNA-binding SARP family transcriptional activator
MPPSSGPGEIKPLIRFRLLGRVRAEGATGPVQIGGATARAVLALLLVRGDAGASTEEIIAGVWGGPGGATRDSVYHYLSGLRRALLPTDAVLETRQPRYRLMVSADAVDWHRFRRLAAAARRTRENGDPALASALLREAIDLWDGPSLADVGSRLDQLRRDMDGQRRAAIETLASVEADRGHYDEVVALLQDELPAGPVRERAAALMIDALTAMGRRDDAGEVYRLTRARLIGEQGLEPGSQLEEAHHRALHGAAPAPGSSGTVLVPISGLPRLDPFFTGRGRELGIVTKSLRAGGGQTLCVVYGMAGLGKTALAVRAVHALADEFADGTIFLDLHGYTEDRTALPAAEALDRLLRRMRVDAAAIPADFDERAAQYRDLLASRRMLIVLDNARNAAQVAPLLPSTGRCAVIVTSRRRLAALDDALVLRLGLPAHQEAVQMFRAVAGPGRLRGEPGTDLLIGGIVDLCGRLPLAIRIAAAQYRDGSPRSLAGLAEKLADEDDRLAELDDGDRSVEASFQVSLRDLSPPVAHTFARLALDPGADFDAFAAAALADVPVGQAGRQLGVLADRHLLTEHAPGRYRFHDLIGVFARKHTLHAVRADERTAALQRLADYFLRTAEAADKRITPHRYRVPIQVLGRSTARPPLPDYHAALAWLTAEQGNLADTCIAAGAAGFDVVCWQLAHLLRGYYFLVKSGPPWIATHEAALAAARRCGDVRAEAMIVNNLGLAHFERGAPGLAADYYRRARSLFAKTADAHGEITARANLAWLLLGENRFADFLAEMRPVLDFYRDNGSERNAAITLRGIGLAEAELGRFEQSAADLRQALEVFTGLGSRLDVAMTWNGLGETYQRAGDTRQAAAAFAQALATSGQSGSEYEQARARHRLGQLAAAAGDPIAAREHWTLALRQYRQLGVPSAAQVQRELDDLTGIADVQVDSHMTR